MASYPFARAEADGHYVSLSSYFQAGRCSPVIPHFERLVAAFADGEMTEYKIPDGQGGYVETITTFVNKQRDQWVTVGSKRAEKVIFCLYASGIGKGSVQRRVIAPR